MIPQNQNNGRSTGRSNSGRQAPARNYNRSANLFGLENLFGGGGGGGTTQTVTQQNLPDWAISDAMSTLGMGNYYTQNPDYRPSTLDRDYSGLRGYDQMGRPNSQVGQFGLNPTGYTNPLLADPINNSNTQRQSNQSPNLDNLVAQLPPDMQGGGLDLGRRPGTGLLFADGWSPTGQDGSSASPTRPDGSIDYSQYGTGLKFADQMPTSGRSAAKYAAPTTGPAATPGGDFNNTAPGGASSGQTSSENQTFNIWDYYDELSGKNKNLDESDSGYDITSPAPGSWQASDGLDEFDSGYDITSPPAIDGGLEFSSEDSWIWGSGDSGNNDNISSSSDSSSSNTSGNTGTTTETPTVDPKDIFNPDDLTPFQAFDRQRFAAPGANTLRGEGILAGRYDQRFGPGGTDPFAAANQAVGTAANYTSGFQGTMGEGGLGGQAGNYQQGLGSATDPNVFQAGNYTSGLPNFANPNADQTNVNSAVGNVNSGLTSTAYSNANAGLTGPQNYNQNFQNLVNQSMNPYQDQVVNQTITDLNRARQMTQNEIGGQAAKSGAFGGSRQALLEAENNRNYLDRVAAATGQLRQQGFESAANRAQQENLQRLGLTAQDLQQTRGLQSQGNLAAQGLTAKDAQDVRGLQSQGALAAQGLRSQGGLAAQGLQSQGALAALGANAGLYQSALGLNAAGDRSAMGYNAGLLGDAMRLDASDLNQRRNLASNEAQFAETANRGAGALNLQGGQALGQLAQAGTADERQRIADILAAGGAGDARNQQDLDFIYNEFNRELDYPGRQIDLRNAAISPATGSIVTTTQPRYQQNPILGGAGAALAAYGMTSNPWIAGGAGLLSLLG